MSDNAKPQTTTRRTGGTMSRLRRRTPANGRRGLRRGAGQRDSGFRQKYGDAQAYARDLAQKLAA